MSNITPQHLLTLRGSKSAMWGGSALILAGLLGSLLLSGCNSNTLKPPTASKNLPVPGGRPLVNTQAPQQQDVQIALASDLLSGSIVANPFLNKLPKILTAADLSEPAAPEEIAVDPFAGVNLLGVAFDSANPMALINVNGSSQILTKGQTIPAPNGPLKISRIGREDIEIVEAGGKAAKKTLALPSIIGFHGANNTSPAAGNAPGNIVNVSADGNAPPSKSLGEKIIDSADRFFGARPKENNLQGMQEP